MAEIFKMPKLGMDMEEGVIARWLKAEGDTVQKGELIAEIETDKAAVEVEAPVSGTVLKLFYPADETVPCGQPIAVIGQPGEPIPTADAPQQLQAEAPAPTAAPAANNDLFFLMPKLGMDMEEGTIVQWLKAEGDPIKKGEALVEIETDKAAVVSESPTDGVVLKLYYPADESVPCGQPIAAIGPAGTPAPSLEQFGAPAAPAQEAAPAAEAVDSDLFFRMPKLGMDMEEGTIVQWLKAEGDTVQKGEALVEIETDKAAVVSEAPVSGTILKIFYPADEAVPCGEPIAAIGPAGTAVPDPKAPVAAAPTEAPKTPEAPQASVAAPAAKRADGRIIASPRARRCAAQNQVDIAAVTGTGENGRIVEADVLDFLAKVPVKTAVRTPQDEIVPLSGMRKIIANRMRQSQQEMAQTNTRMDVDMTNMIAFRKQINERLASQGIKVSYVDLLVAVCAKALVENPQANASLEADGIHYKNYANIGIAVDSERGLVVPVVKDADILSIPEISKASRALIDKARNGALKPDDMKGGTFTISNLGMFEVDSFTAIVNPPETCILAVGRIADRAVVVDGQIVARPMMNLCLSYDHRVIDGAPSARFLQCVKHYIENPVWLLL